MDIQKSVIAKLMARVKTAWVQWVIGAVIGALAAAGVITVTGCTVNVDKRADGSLSYRGAIVVPVSKDAK